LPPKVLSMHEARAAITTISFVDQYCSAYQKLFPEVRSFEGFISSCWNDF